MNDGRHFDQVAAESVHDPVIAEVELAKVFYAVLRNDAPGFREVLQPLDVSHDALDKEPGVVGGVPGDEFRDGVEVAERGRRQTT
jgi:hypothetical protein